jgi:uncharacterized membrane protein
MRNVRSLTVGGVCVALGVVLPLLFHYTFAVLPRIVLPMHYPVFLAGTLLDPFGAAVVGLLTPALSMGLTGMPTPDQTFRMMGELATYGLVVSLVLRLSGGFRYTTCLLALAVAMILGRAVHAVLAMLLLGFQGWKLYLAFYLPGVPGMAAQFLLVPPLAMRVRRALKLPVSGPS